MLRKYDRFCYKRTADFPAAGVHYDEIPVEKLEGEIAGTLVGQFRELMSKVEVVKTENKKLNGPKISLYTKIMTNAGRKAKFDTVAYKFDLSAADCETLSASVSKQRDLFHQFSVQLHGVQKGVDAKGMGRSERWLLGIFQTFELSIDELLDIFENQTRVLNSGADPHIKSGAFIDLFREERRVYKRIAKASKDFAQKGGQGKMIRAAKEAGKSGKLERVRMVLTLVTVSAAVAVVCAPSTSFAAPSDDIGQLAKSDFIKICEVILRYIAGALAWVLHGIGDLVDEHYVISGLAIVIGAVVAIIYKIRN